ncbi:MAG: cupin domain-containing protein [Comamonadaceae bacterium]|nr:MAG: cupin domain-containing protein [Comamonadaceae bacterium]
MDVHSPLSLLAGLTPAQFMQRHWQKKPLLVRQAIPGLEPFLSRPELFALAGREEVESRLIVQDGAEWRMKKGPFAPRSLPALNRPAWTLLVQGADTHCAAGHDLLRQFRFVPDARLDDLMISFATEGGGVGPHFDSYDVFLLQASGSRRWKIGRQKNLSLQEGVPLKLLSHFEPEEEFVLEAGDMLYLPPRYAHDGVAEAATGADGKPAACMTYSIGFRAPGRSELASALLQRLAEYSSDEAQTHETEPGKAASGLYSDPKQPATGSPAALPESLVAFAEDAVKKALQDPLAMACALGEYMTEPKASVWFDAPENAIDPADMADAGLGLALDAKTRMMYDANHIFINGESWRARGADARLMRRLADQRWLTAAELAKASDAALDLLGQWQEDGWVVAG